MPLERPIITWSAPAKPVGSNDLAGQRTKTPLHAVADHGAADLARDGEADAHRRVHVLAVADEKDEAGRRRALAGIGGKEIGAREMVTRR